MQGGPGGGIWGEASDEVVYSGGGLVPVYPASFFEDFGSGTEFAGGDGILRDRLYAIGDDIFQGADGQAGSKFHEFVMEGAGIVSGQYGDALLYIISPVSISCFRKKVVTPVSLSPFIMAQFMGAAPRY